MLALLRVEKACEMLAEAVSVDEVKQIRDQSLAMKAYARTQKAGHTMALDAAEIQLRAEVRLGEMLRELPKDAGGRPSKTAAKVAGVKTPAVEDIGIDLRRARDYEAAAKIPKQQLEAYVAAFRADDRAPTSRGLISAVAAATSSSPDYDGDEWFTPAEWVERARAALGGTIDLDPASNIHAQKTVKAKRFYTKEDDGLSKPWTGRVFCNPPYSTALIKAFTNKLLASLEELREATAAVYLVNNCTDAGWFQDCLHWCDAVCFPRGRIAFENANGVGFATRQGQAFFWFGMDAGPFRAAFKDCGAILVPE